MTSRMTSCGLFALAATAPLYANAVPAAVRPALMVKFSKHIWLYCEFGLKAKPPEALSTRRTVLPTPCPTKQTGPVAVTREAKRITPKGRTIFGVPNGSPPFVVTKFCASVIALESPGASSLVPFADTYSEASMTVLLFVSYHASADVVPKKKPLLYVARRLGARGGERRALVLREEVARRAGAEEESFVVLREPPVG